MIALGLSSSREEVLEEMDRDAIQKRVRYGYGRMDDGKRVRYNWVP